MNVSDFIKTKVLEVFYCEHDTLLKRKARKEFLFSFLAYLLVKLIHSSLDAYFDGYFYGRWRWTILSQSTPVWMLTSTCHEVFVEDLTRSSQSTPVWIRTLTMLTNYLVQCLLCRNLLQFGYAL